MYKAHTEQPELLPRIQSQSKMRKISHANRSDHKNTEQQVVSRTRVATSSQKLSLVRPNSERKTLQSANSLKTVHYETTNAIYAKKIQNLQKQTYLLDREIKQRRQELAKLKNKAENQDEAATVTSQITKQGQGKNTKTDKNIALNRMDALRKKIDKQMQKNSKIQDQIDKIRKEINTTKKLNHQLQTQLVTVNEIYDQENQLSSRFQHEISRKNEDLHKKKIDMIHQKAHVIKNYDEIMKKIDVEINNDKMSRAGETRQAKSDFYITDVYQKQNYKAKRIKQLTENSPKSNKKNHNTAQNTFLKEKIQQFETKFLELKQKTGSQSIEQVTNNFLQEYEKNYDEYKFINERYEYLQELKQKNIQSQSKYTALKQQLKQREKNRNKKEIQELGRNLMQIKGKKQDFQMRINKSNKIYKNLKRFIIDFGKRMPLNMFSKFNIEKQSNLADIITPKNIVDFLNEILVFKSSLPNASKVTIQESMVNSSRSHNQHIFEQHLDTIKQQHHFDKDKLFNRQDFIKNLQMVHPKKKASLKSNTQKN